MNVHLCNWYFLVSAVSDADPNGVLLPKNRRSGLILDRRRYEPNPPKIGGL